MDFVFELAQPDDCDEIIALYESVFQRKVTKEWWKWRFINNPIDKRHVAVARHGHIIASHYAISPIKLKMGSEKKLFALSMSTMTHKNYQGHGLFPQTAEFLYENLSTSGYSGVIGFPNANSHRTFIEKLGWSDIMLQPTVSLSLEKLERPEKTLGLSILPVSNELTKMVDSEEGHEQCQIGICEEANFMNWRYSVESGNEYFFVNDEETQFDKPIIIFKFHKHDCIDIVFSKNLTLDFVSRALFQVADHFQVSNLKIMTWQNIHSDGFRLWEKLGARVSEPLTYFAGREFTTETGLFNAKNWKMDMALSDVY